MQCQKQPFAFKRSERQLYFRWYLPSFATHPAFLIQAGRTNGKTNNTILGVNRTSVTVCPFCYGCDSFARVKGEVCAELPSFRKYPPSTHVPCVVLSAGGMTSGERAHPSLSIDECSKNNCPVYCKNSIALHRLERIAIFILPHLATTWFLLSYGTVSLDSIERV